MTSPVTVRRASPDDVDLVAPLFARYRAFYGRPYDEPAAAAFLTERLQKAESVVLLAEPTGADTGLTGGPVGFVQLYPGFSSLAVAPSWVLNDLLVLESARGAGVATALLRYAELLARRAGAVSLVLETAQDNLAAQRLYEREGYRVDGLRHYEKPLP